MFRFMAVLYMRGFSTSSTTKSKCKMTGGGRSMVACSCDPDCKIIEKRDELYAFIANANCRVRGPCVHTNDAPKSGDCSCEHVCIADVSEMYCTMMHNNTSSN